MLENHSLFMASGSQVVEERRPTFAADQYEARRFGSFYPSRFAHAIDAPVRPGRRVPDAKNHRSVAPMIGTVRL